MTQMTRNLIAVAVLTAALTLILFVVAAPAGAVTIRNDNGGALPTYYKRLGKMIVANERVIIDGRCGSACTVFLKRACATHRAEIGFHHPRFPRKMMRKLAPSSLAYVREKEREYAKRMLDDYPPAVRAWVMKRGGLTDRIIWLRGAEAVKVVGACR